MYHLHHSGWENPLKASLRALRRAPDATSRAVKKMANATATHSRSAARGAAAVAVVVPVETTRGCKTAATITARAAEDGTRHVVMSLKVIPELVRGGADCASQAGNQAYVKALEAGAAAADTVGNINIRKPKGLKGRLMSLGTSFVEKRKALYGLLDVGLERTTDRIFMIDRISPDRQMRP